MSATCYYPYPLSISLTTDWKTNLLTPHPLNLVIVDKLEIVLIGVKWAFHFDGIQQLNLVKKQFKKVLGGGSLSV